MQEDLLKIGATFDKWSGNTLIATDSNNRERRINLPDSYCYRELKNILFKGCKINILSCSADDDGTLSPKDIIFEPDYLIDISSLAHCVQPYGSPALGYVLNLFDKNEESAARLLGEAANMFLDDCANESKESPATYKTSVAKFFREYPLQLTSCDNIDKAFFAQLQQQFHNIQIKIGYIGIDSGSGYRRDNVQLEPSFFCEALGLQGRIDLLQSDYRRLIELKSGKYDEFRGEAKEEHKLQMSLYKEMLCYNLRIPRNNIQTHLFYSRYPRFYSMESGAESISAALMLRNKIVALLLQLGNDGLRDTITALTPDDLNENGTTSRLWTQYIRPSFQNILTPIKEADSLLLDYFFGNLAFVAREMLLAKRGEGNSDNSRSFADVWLATLEEKQRNGNILIDLELTCLNEDEGITDLTLKIPEYSCDFYPNFRAGDTVFIYRRESHEETATNRQVTRGTLTRITPHEVTVHLRHKQRNKIIFPTESRYAIEHDHMDSTFRATFRDLYSLLTAPTERISLLLSQRRPTFDRSLTLKRNYGNDYINEIVLKAKQAQELFMLVGPPGTGKTSQALSSMVREFFDNENNIIIASYTNRAVDEICQTLERLPESPEYIRIGSEQNCAPPYRPRLLKNVIAHCNKRDEIHNAIDNTHIFVGTIASLTSRKELFRMKRFSTAIIDEASQILESQFAGLIAAISPNGECAIGKFILIGDPKQLPAVVTQKPQMTQVKSSRLQSVGITDYSMSLFERLYNWYSKHPVEGITATLSRQGRMHPAIGNFANRYFYSGILESVPLQHQTEELPYKIFDNSNSNQKIIATRRTAFIGINDDNNDRRPKSNRSEAIAIAQFVEAYYNVCKANEIECNPAEDIGVIVPFRNQIAMVMNELSLLNIPHSEEIIIDTVERFQGSQRDVILFGTTITSPDEMPMLSSIATDADGNSIDRKLNVAVTRARKQMFVFGNPDALNVSPLYKALIEELNR